MGWLKRSSCGEGEVRVLAAGARPAEARGGRGCGLGREVALTRTQGEDPEVRHLDRTSVAG